jgi:hypothetical protein
VIAGEIDAPVVLLAARESMNGSESSLKPEFAPTDRRPGGQWKFRGSDSATSDVSEVSLKVSVVVI